MISVLHLGSIDYATALQLQQRLVALRKEGAIGDVLLLLEHPPVITLGRNAQPANILASPDQLAAKDVQCFDCDRGGDVTFHGPGQLVAYPIFDLRGFRSADSMRGHLGAVEFVRRLEEVLIQTCGHFRIPCQRIPGLTGVWTAPEHGEPAKIAAIGIHISRAVTSHGLALNVNTNLDYFHLIVPCGIAQRPVTSIHKELHRTIPMPDVEEAVVHAFSAVFETEVARSATLDDLLIPRLDIPLKTPPNLRQLHQEDETSWA